MTLPRTFIAAWERSELVVDGETIEGGRTVWVEAGTAFVDTRGPGGFASDTIFAGTTSWEDPYLTWHHTIDADANNADADRGLITLVGDDLVEDGEFVSDDVDGRVVTYREYWRRLPAGAGPTLAAVTTGGLAVRVGDHSSIAVDRRPDGGGIAARYSRWTGAAWSTEIEFGDRLELDRLPGPLDSAAHLPEHWRWK